MIARPFIKWVGGKRQILPFILSRLPSTFNSYYEPFVGGGALFWSLYNAGRLSDIKNGNVVLSDANLRLIRTYRAVRDDVELVIDVLRACINSKDFYLEMRASDVDAMSNANVAAWFIYLNKCGFNGLYRVNSKNQFNVPYGDQPTAQVGPLTDADHLRVCSMALQGVELRNCDFQAAVDEAWTGSLVYFDPPYVPLTATSNFTSYTAGGFGAEEQVRLRDTARVLKQGRGTHTILSNSSAPLVYDLYRDGFEIAEVRAVRSLNRDGDKRGAVKELVIS